MTVSFLYVKNNELAQPLMMRDESLLAMVCLLGVGLEGEEGELPSKETHMLPSIFFWGKDQSTD